MSPVFDVSWIEDLRSRYEHLPEYQRPRLYWLATKPICAAERSRIERWVSCLLVEHREAVIARLRNPDLFETTCNELLVGELLRRCGHQPEYESPMGGKTPDWYVHPTPDHPAFCVEVVTVQPPDVMRREDRLWHELLIRLKQIDHYFDLVISAVRGRSLQGKDPKRIVSFVREWFDSFDPFQTVEPQEKTYVDGPLCIRFRLLPRGTVHGGAVTVLGSVLWFRVRWERLRRSLRKKVRKYRQTEKEKIALVVAIVCTFGSGLGEDDLLNILFGQQQVAVTNRNGTVVDSEVTRDRTGLLTPKRQRERTTVLNTRPAVILWVERGQPPMMKVVHNPYASLPLPPQAFPGFANLVRVGSDDRSLQLRWVKP